MSRRPKAPPRLYFSFRSPYSWLAVRQLEDRHPEISRQLEYIPYWDPDQVTLAGVSSRGAKFHYQQMSKAKHLYLLQDIRRLTAERGYRMRWPIDRDPWWDLPHLAYLAARREGREAELFKALNTARWERGEDICTRDTVRRCAEQAGLDGAVMTGAPEDPDIRAEGIDCLCRAYDDGVFGIPYLRYGRDKFWGLDRLETFVDVFAGAPWVPDQNAATAPLSPEHLNGHALISDAYDTDAPGGCG
ncbi:DsbA family protein [Actinomadura barringtoniae]|uniref:2-hydroxychromene-2-carboxylate isomerase n=1 Tax=Actinomadura barringtoniae TaxID=1427535 RepID=A0A939T4H3_9ACTN|nr:DsbA family protein [Actinomadura barringtoniae]MBO2445912.1 DsbA family protein [Actinomadura barringtoniae]